MYIQRRIVTAGKTQGSSQVLSYRIKHTRAYIEFKRGEFAFSPVLAHGLILFVNLAQVTAIHNKIERVV